MGYMMAEIVDDEMRALVRGYLQMAKDDPSLEPKIVEVLAHGITASGLVLMMDQHATVYPIEARDILAELARSLADLSQDTPTSLLKKAREG